MADYLRGLTFYENKAQAAGQTDLLKQIQAEKARLAAQGGTGARPAHGAGQSVVLNGDFTQKKADGTPEGWTAGEPGKGAVATEQGATFLRMVTADKKETWFIQYIDRPPDARELQVSVRLRSPDFKGQGVVRNRDCPARRGQSTRRARPALRLESALPGLEDDERDGNDPSRDQTDHRPVQQGRLLGDR